MESFSWLVDRARPGAGWAALLALTALADGVRQPVLHILPMNVTEWMRSVAVVFMTTAIWGCAGAEDATAQGSDVGRTEPVAASPGDAPHADDTKDSRAAAPPSTPSTPPTAGRVPLRFSQLGELAQLSGGTPDGSFAFDDGRILLPKLMTAIVNVDKSTGSLEGGITLQNGAAHMVADFSVSLANPLGQTSEVPKVIDARGTYRVEGAHVLVEWQSGTGIENLPHDIEFTIEAGKGTMRWNEALPGGAQAVVEVYAHAADQ